LSAGSDPAERTSRRPPERWLRYQSRRSTDGKAGPSIRGHDQCLTYWGPGWSTRLVSLFISHSSGDRLAVEQVSDRLRVEGYGSLFIDFDPMLGIQAGRSWERELYSQLRIADAVVFLISSTSVLSNWCFAEIALARAMNKVIFPVRLESGVYMPLLAEVQTVNMLDFEAGFAQLMNGLQRARADQQARTGGHGRYQHRPTTTPVDVGTRLSKVALDTRSRTE
jgi:hypothetical protein